MNEVLRDYVILRPLKFIHPLLILSCCSKISSTKSVPDNIRSLYIQTFLHLLLGLHQDRLLGCTITAITIKHLLSMIISRYTTTPRVILLFTSCTHNGACTYFLEIPQGHFQSTSRLL